MSNQLGVRPLVTDALTQASFHVLGSGPAVAAISAYLALAQAQAVLAANMVGQQQQQALISQAATARSVRKLLGGRRSAAFGATLKTANVMETVAPLRSAAPAPGPAPTSGSGSGPESGPGGLAVW